MVARPLSIEGVWKGYPRGGRQWTEVLANVSLEVAPGDVVAVVGGRLVGKTTVLMVAAGLEPPDRGTVSLGGQILADCPERERSRLRGRDILWVDRDGPKLGMEVAKWVAWPLALHGCGRRHAERAARQALELVGARKCSGRRWGELSNWQRVLVSLARAFAGRPHVVIVDDMLDGLGPRGTEEAFDLLRRLADTSEPRCGVLMSASDMDSAVYADQVWSITPKLTLKLMAGRVTGGNVVPFPDRANTRAGGTLGVGSS